MGSLFGGSKPATKTSTQSGTSTVKPHADALAAYQGILGNAMDVGQTPWNADTAKQVAGFTDPQYQAFQNIQSGIAQPFLNAAQGYTQSAAGPISHASIQGYMNPYTQEVIDATQADFDVQNARQQSGVVGDARKAGSLGGSREAVAQALTAEAQTRAQSPIMAQLRQQGYGQALSAAQQDAARQMQASGQMQQMAQLAGLDTDWLMKSGAMQQGLTQAQMDAFSQNAAAQSAYPFQTQQWLASIAGSLGPLMGSTTNSSGTSTATATPASPNMWSQAIGAGIAALPYLADGGRVRGYADGGGICQPADVAAPGGTGGVMQGAAPAMTTGGMMQSPPPMQPLAPPVQQTPAPMGMTGGVMQPQPTPSPGGMTGGVMQGAAPSADSQPMQTGGAPGMPWMGHLSWLANGGRVSRAEGGGIAGSYVPMGQLSPAQMLAAPAVNMQAPNVEAGTTDHMSDIIGAAKQFGKGFKGIAGLGEKMRTSSGPGGWDTTVTYGDPANPTLGSMADNLGYGLSNAASGIGAMFQGFADGGGVYDDGPINGMGYDRRDPMPFAPIEGEDLMDHALVRAEAMPAPPLADAPGGSGAASPTPSGLAPMSDMTVRDMPDSAGIAYQPTGTTGEPNGLNPTGGVSVSAPISSRPSAGASESAYAKPSGSFFGRLFSGSLTPEEAAGVTQAGLGMMVSGATNPVPGLGGVFRDFGIGAQQGIATTGQANKGRREAYIANQKMALLKQAAELRGREFDMNAAMHPYQLQEAKNKSAASAYIKYDPTKGMIDVRTGKVISGGDSTDASQRVFNEAYAKKAPEYLEKSAEAHQNANEIIATTNELQSLAPGVISGAWADYRLQSQKIARMLGLSYDPDAIKNTEQFRAKTQQFVIAAASKLKPLSDADIKFIQLGLPGIERDPQSLVPMLQGMRRIAERDALYQSERMAALRRGRVPDDVAIRAKVERELPGPGTPEYARQRAEAQAAAQARAAGIAPASGYTGTSSGIAASARPVSPQQAPPPATKVNAIAAKARAVPDGSLVTAGGKVYRKSGDTLVPADRSAYSIGFFSDPKTPDGQPIPRLD